MSEEQSQEISTPKKNWYERYYKLLLIIPAVLIIFSIGYLFNFNAQKSYSDTMTNAVVPGRI